MVKKDLKVRIEWTKMIMHDPFYLWLYLVNNRNEILINQTRYGLLTRSLLVQEFRQLKNLLKKKYFRKMFKIVALLLVLAACALSAPGSRHRRQIFASQSCLGPCSQNSFGPNGVTTRRQFSGPGTIQQSSNFQQFGGPGAVQGPNVFGPFGTFSQIFG